MCVQKRKVYLPKTALAFGLLCGNVKESRLRIEIPCFQRNFEFGRYIRPNIRPTQSVLRIFSLKFVQACPGAHLEAARSEKKTGSSSLSAVNAWLLLTSSKVCECSGHIFGAISANPTSLTSQSEVLNQITGYVTLFRCSWRSQHDTE